ncbi:glycosyltransferase family 4 protein [Legionella bononiensis]|uniref:Glycosyltransferase family 4 protein n=1 Tax=Legionella bononiensis TaxID=2793102 RepID=A0ABS1WFH6_9GAMM|nr:glycosyltransferase family 4 protein [Legionella bononiensis]MBL7481567.1 glycosyltransferase family 4 protein [Legionella bononiensis]MBL7528114.1 glycosyltransferase family 4 protein [Legionella bononiensis]MBL7562590.1 glycosyltransferase family 4 protein [Legionella bononiensis]
MKIFNAMFSKVNGGVEQVFLNYTKVLESLGNEIIPVIHPWSQIRKACAGDNLRTLFSYGRKDFIAVHRLRQLILKEQPDCIIMHTKRAAILFEKTETKVPKIAVCHTIESYDELAKVSDAVIAITEHMYQDIMSQGESTKKIYTVPNMISIPEDLSYKEPKSTVIPVIGASARFSDLKGLDVFIDALALLKRNGISFKALIAGDGKQKKQYIKQINQHSLQNEVTLLGWIDDKQAFYESLDIFCHPSLKESFGLVVVESMMHSLPMVLTQISGPLEIVGDTECAVMVPPSDPVSLANGLERLIKDSGLAKRLSYNGFLRANTYSSRTIGPILNRVVNEVCNS